MGKSSNPGWFQPNGNGANNYGGSGKPLKGRSAGKKDGCALAALGLVGAGAALLTGLGWGAVELVKAVV